MVYRKSKGDLMVRIILSITAVIFALPALYVVFSAFQDGEGFGLGKFRELFQNYPSYLVALRNSFFYAVIITAGGLFLSVPVAYLFSKVRFRARNSLFFVYIVIMMLPAQSTILGQYLLMKSLDWVDTRQALYLPLMLSPLTVFLLRQNLKLISSELIDATRLETNSFFVLLFGVVLPQIKGTIAAAGVLLFCESWNIIEQAMILLPRREEIKPLSVMMGRYPDELQAACAAVYLAPVAIVLIAFAVFGAARRMKAGQ
ncbi:MAG: carbohydrate ABC transporter permease [Lachnospiraceae bacterium]|jgi:multiple sugar transport system permease protein|nr:carbohydrate ABC transporter permease [Lachnospiraceae bacterium]